MGKKNTRGVYYRRDRKCWQHRKFFHGKIYSGFHATEAEARKAYEEVEKKIGLMKRVPVNSLGAVINDFLIASKRADKSPERIKALIYNFNKFIVPHFGADTPIASITKAEVEQFVKDQKSRGVKNSTIWHYVVDLAAVFNYYIETYDVAIPNPVKKANLKSIRNRRVVKPPLDLAAINRAIGCLSGPNDFYDWLFVMFACCTGGRRGEINRTKWADLFIDDVENAWYRVPGTKTDGSLALNPLPRSLARALVGWRASCRSDFVFPGRSAQTKGKQIKRRNAIFKKIKVRTAFQSLRFQHPELGDDEIKELAKEDNYRAGVNLRTKDLRDYYASMVKTTDVRVLKELMRHENLSTTTKYSRRRYELMREAVQDLGENFGENQPPEQGKKRHETPFWGNQYVSRDHWINAEKQ